MRLSYADAHILVFFLFALLASVPALALVTSRQEFLNALEAQMKEDTGKVAVENAAAEMAAPEMAATATASQRRQLFLWQGENVDGLLRFMYDPIMSTLHKAASLTLDPSMWSITQRWGDPQDEDAVRQLQSLECGDVIVWIGHFDVDKVDFNEAPKQSTEATRALNVAEDLGNRSLMERGVTTVYYQTEPLAVEHLYSRNFPPTFCDVRTSPFTEYWDYSQANIKIMLKHCASFESSKGKEQGVRPVMRYVPPGPLDALTERRNDIIEECAANVGWLQGLRGEHRNEYISAFNDHLGSMYPNFTAVNVRSGIWDYDAYGDFIKQSCVQLSVHKFGQEGMAFEAFRAAPMVSGGALMLSEKCDAEDQSDWDGIVVFAESPEDAGRQAAQLLQSSSEERKALARMRAKLFDERFEPAAVWRKAHIPDDWKIANALDTLAQCQEHAA